MGPLLQKAEDKHKKESESVLSASAAAATKITSVKTGGLVEKIIKTSLHEVLDKQKKFAGVFKNAVGAQTARSLVTHQDIVAQGHNGAKQLFNAQIKMVAKKYKLDENGFRALINQAKSGNSKNALKTAKKLHKRHLEVVQEESRQLAETERLHGYFNDI